jgi:hypothetical protein
VRYLFFFFVVVEHIKPIRGATADNATRISSSMAHNLSVVSFNIIQRLEAKFT